MEAEERLEEELRQAKAVRAGREAAAAADTDKALPKSEMERMRERERREVINRAQLALLVRGGGQLAQARAACSQGTKAAVGGHGPALDAGPAAYCCRCVPRRRRRRR